MIISTKQRKVKSQNCKYMLPLDSLRYQQILTTDLVGNVYQQERRTCNQILEKLRQRLKCFEEVGTFGILYNFSGHSHPTSAVFTLFCLGCTGVCLL